MTSSVSPGNPCATCGKCCDSYIVSVCGYDVWRISTRQRLSPEQFLVAMPQDKRGRDGFLLSSEGPTFGLLLDKQGPLKATQPCVFLLRLGGGHRPCGVYADRPVVCRTYPMAIWRGAVVQRSKTLCPPDSWPSAAVAHPRWREALQGQRMRFDVYYQVVARWNARVASAKPEQRFALPALIGPVAGGTWRAAAGPGQRLGLAEYYSYLVNVYDRLEGIDRDVGEAGLAQVQMSWGRMPAPARTGVDGVAGAAETAVASPAAPEPPAGPVEFLVRPDDAPWLAYLRRVQRVVDSFYPEVAPQPLRLYGPANDLAPEAGPDAAAEGQGTMGMVS